jgi:hypothetical protein
MGFEQQPTEPIAGDSHDRIHAMALASEIERREQSGRHLKFSVAGLQTKDLVQHEADMGLTGGVDPAVQIDGATDAENHGKGRDTLGRGRRRSG